MSRSEPNLQTALSFRDASAVRGGRTIWSQGTFDVPAGSVVAVIGANGSGKTTLVRMILGLVPLSSGTLQVFGLRPGENNELIGYVPQNYAATAGEAIRGVDLVLLGQTGRRWGPRATTADQLHRAQRTLAQLDANEFAQKRLSTLSGGQRQRIAIAEAMVSGPRMLILDEPLASLDIGSQRDTVLLVDKLHRDLGLTVVVVAHDLNPLLPILDSAIYLLDGHAHYAPIGNVVDDELLTHLYGSPISVVHTAQGEMYMRSVL